MNGLKKCVVKIIFGGLLVCTVCGVMLIGNVKNNTSSINTVLNHTTNYTDNTHEQYTMDTVYAIEKIYIKEKSSINEDIFDVIEPNTALIRIAEMDNGWSKIIYNKEIRYIQSNLLTK